MYLLDVPRQSDEIFGIWQEYVQEKMKKVFADVSVQPMSSSCIPKLEQVAPSSLQVYPPLDASLIKSLDKWPVKKNPWLTELGL